MDIRIIILIILTISAYIIGSIPFGLVISYFAKRIDIRKVGSGNIGTTNVFRSLGLFLALVTLLLDSAKCLLPMYICSYILKLWNIQSNIAHNMALVVGCFVTLGHMFSIFLKFKGGKGVAAGWIIVAYHSYIFGIIVMCIWAILTMVTKYASLASIIAIAISMVFIAMTVEDTAIRFFILSVLSLGLYKHKINIIRLINGKELSIK